MNAQNTLFELMIKDEASDLQYPTLLKRSSVHQSFQSIDVLILLECGFKTQEITLSISHWFCKGFETALEDVRHQQENQLPTFPLYVAAFIVAL